MRKKLLISTAALACAIVPHPNGLAENPLVQIVTEATKKHEHDGHPVEDIIEVEMPDTMDAYAISGKTVVHQNNITVAWFAGDIIKKPL